MSTAMLLPPAEARRANGGAPARLAVVRWAWRLFRHEWRQQLLILALIVVAVGATIIGSAVSADTPQPANVGFGSAQDLATFQGSDPRLAGEIANLQHRFGATDVIENETLSIPGSVNTYQLARAEPQGPVRPTDARVAQRELPDRAGPGCNDRRGGIGLQREDR